MPEAGPTLVVTRNLPPLMGGMERLNLHLVLGLSKVSEVSIVGPAGCASFLPSNWRVAEAPHKPLPVFFAGALAGALGLAIRSRPTVVVAGSGLVAPIAWCCARMFGARFLVYLHGLDLVADSTLYRRLWLPFIRKADLALVNSHNTQRLAVERGVAPSAVIHPGTQLHCDDPMAAKAFRAHYGLGDRPLLLSVGRLTPRKGLAEFIRFSLGRVLDQWPDALLLVIGGDAADAVKADRSSEEVRVLAAATSAGLTEHVRLLSHCDDRTLSAAYQAADVYVFPVQDRAGDVEGFGMVAIEAAAHGLPTVAFAVGGVPDAVLDNETGELVAAGDFPELAEAAIRQLRRGRDPLQRARVREAATCFSWDRFDRELLSWVFEVGHD
jgi:phosphatidyl-myo-inositol dimannoside synthase